MKIGDTLFLNDVQADRAADVGLCIDLYLLKDITTRAPLGLSSYKFLSLRTGGNVRLYENLDDISMAQDVYVTRIFI